MFEAKVWHSLILCFLTSQIASLSFASQTTRSALSETLSLALYSYALGSNLLFRVYQKLNYFGQDFFLFVGVCKHPHAPLRGASPRDPKGLELYHCRSNSL